MGQDEELLTPALGAQWTCPVAADVVPLAERNPNIQPVDPQVWA